MKAHIKALTARHFGFLTSTADLDWFFHEDDLIDIKWDDLRVGYEVEFDAKQTLKGLRANNVRRIQPVKVGSDGNARN